MLGALFTQKSLCTLVVYEILRCTERQVRCMRELFILKYGWIYVSSSFGCSYAISSFVLIYVSLSFEELSRGMKAV
jgi:hypothetical protein